MRAIITHSLFIFTLFFTAVYIVERLVLQTIYVLNKEVLQFLGLKFMVYSDVTLMPPSNSGHWILN